MAQAPESWLGFLLVGDEPHLESLYPGDHQHGLRHPGPEATHHPLAWAEHTLAPRHQVLEEVKCAKPAMFDKLRARFFAVVRFPFLF